MRTALQRKIVKIQKDVAVLKNISGDELRQTKGAYEISDTFCQLLNSGEIRAAEKNAEGIWYVNTWVKEGILIGMKLGQIAKLSKKGESLQFLDKDTLPLRQISGLMQRGIRIVPGGTSIRTGSYIGDKVIIMPPSYINIGAYIDEETMIDSHVLKGSCAQIGKRCHISAGVQIGGVLE